jgi:hypothetical protein
MAPLFAQGLAPGCGVSTQVRARSARGILLVESGSNQDEAVRSLSAPRFLPDCSLTKCNVTQQPFSALHTV